MILGNFGLKETPRLKLLFDFHRCQNFHSVGTMAAVFYNQTNSPSSSILHERSE